MRGLRAVAPLLAVALLAVPSGASGQDRPSAPARSDLVAGDLVAQDPRAPQTSDGLPGLRAPRLSARAAAPVISDRTVRQVAPGVRLVQWTQTDGRGAQVVHLLAADLATPGLAVRYAGPARVGSTAALPDLVLPSAVGAVNGDFFDIGDTGAPLGVGVEARAVRHGPRQGWLQSMRVVGRDQVAFGPTPVVPRLVGRPAYRLTNLNSPHVEPSGIGAYTPAWGLTPGRTVVDDAPRSRQVVVRGGKVVSNTRKLVRGKRIAGFVLIGRGEGADALRRLHRGTRLALTTGIEENPRVVISGSDQLVADGAALPLDDVALHPRTAVGWNADLSRLLLVVVDGRSEESRGATLAELAALFVRRGVEYALNLDGGGSSTMLADAPGDQGLRTVNVPSDGRLRHVANGLQLTYVPPPTP